MSSHVAVLMGGWSAEREVSLVSGAACAEALRACGHAVSEVDVGHDLAQVLTDLRPDVAFNALHGRWGEDGCVQGLLEVLQIPYTHSGVMASAVAMHKPTAKEVFEAAGIRCSEGLIVNKAAFKDEPPLPAPYVIKPINEGSSVGVHIVFEGENYSISGDADWHFGDQVLVEKYIAGREIQVAVMGDRALGAIDIKPVGRFYDYDAKYVDGQSDHIMPAPMPATDYDYVLELALRAHQAAGCRGVSRADFRLAPDVGADGGFYLLEINTQPGMTPTSLVPEIAAHLGITFEELVDWMVADAGIAR